MKIFYFYILIISIVYCLNQQNEFRILNLNDIKDLDSYIPIKLGQKFIIEIEGNPTTGYMWSLENHDNLKNSNLVTPLNLDEHHSAEYYGKNYDKKTVQDEKVRLSGTGGIYHFKFQANSEKIGEETLNFVYKRSWENDGQSRKSINLKIVKIEPDSDL